MQSEPLNLEREVLSIMRDLQLCYQTVYELDKRLNSALVKLTQDVEFLKAERINQLRSKDHGYSNIHI